jgi:hypothetical protein
MRDAIILAIKLFVHTGVCPAPSYYPEPAAIEGHACVTGGCCFPFTTEMPHTAVMDHHIEEVARRNEGTL